MEELTHIDGLSIDQLCDRYNLKKAQLYNRKNALNLDFEVPKGSRKAIANSAQISRLDELDSYLKAGGQIDQFGATRAIQPSSQVSNLPSSRQSNILSTRLDEPLPTDVPIAQGMVMLAEAIAQNLAPANRIAELRDRLNLLEDLYIRAVPIPSSDLKLLLNRKSIAGAEIFAYGFRIAKTDRRQSGQWLWLIDRE
jgi:hypothetical protein